MNAQTAKQVNLKAAIEGDSSELIQKLNSHPDAIRKAATVTNCIAEGYAPKGYGLADFTIIRQKDIYHLFHIPRVPGNSCIHPANEHWLGHAISSDLDTWTTLDPVLCTEAHNYFESSHVWAPFVYQEDGKSYMYYTGLSNEPSQVICMAQSDDPELRRWTRSKENPLIPLEGFDWHWRNKEGHVRHARDPHVIKVDNHYLLVYTAMHKNGCPAVGGMISNDLLHWEDIGPILYRPMPSKDWLPESINIQALDDGNWILIASQSPGLEYYISSDPHHWHDIEPQSIEFINGDKDQVVAPEIIMKNDSTQEWLIAFFESNNNRMFLGMLDLKTEPWTLKKISSL